MVVKQQNIETLEKMLSPEFIISVNIEATGLDEIQRIPGTSKE